MASVIAFHTAFGLPGRSTPSAEVAPELRELRIRLLEEELEEFAIAARTGDLVGLADALGDIAYVLYGTSLTYGVNLDAIIEEIHRANMSKLDENGRPLMRPDGKVLKGTRYRPPNIPGVLAGQLPLPFPSEAVTPPT